MARPHGRKSLLLPQTFSQCVTNSTLVWLCWELLGQDALWALTFAPAVLASLGVPLP